MDVAGAFCSSGFFFFFGLGVSSDSARGGLGRFWILASTSGSFSSRYLRLLESRRGAGAR